MQKRELPDFSIHEIAHTYFKPRQQFLCYWKTPDQLKRSLAFVTKISYEILRCIGRKHPLMSKSIASWDSASFRRMELSLVIRRFTHLINRSDTRPQSWEKGMRAAELSPNCGLSERALIRYLPCPASGLLQSGIWMGEDGDDQQVLLVLCLP